MPDADDVFVGELAPGNLIVFNREKRVWRYDWRSSRHTADTRHCLRVFILEPGFEPLIVDSPPFSVYFHVPVRRTTGLDCQVRSIVDVMKLRLCRDDQEWDAMEERLDLISSSSDMWSDDMSLVDDASVQNIESLERFDDLLALAAEFILVQFATFRSFAEFNNALAGFFRDEGTTVAAVAQKIKSGDLASEDFIAKESGLGEDPFLPLFTPALALDSFFVSARNYISTMMGTGEVFTPEIAPSNDVSGEFIPAAEVYDLISYFRLLSGWSGFEHLVHASHVTGLLLKIEGPRQVLLCKSVSKVSLVSTNIRFRLGIPMRAPSSAADVMRHPWGGIGITWATSSGLCGVQCEHPRYRLLSIFSLCPEGLRASYRLQCLEGGSWITLRSVNDATMLRIH